MPETQTHDAPALNVGDLVGRHVALERLTIHHIDDIALAGATDRSTFGYTNVPGNVSEARTYVEALLADTARTVAAPFVQRRVADGVIVGCTRYMSPAWPLARRDPDEIEVGGTWLVADAQRSPINSEAKLLLLTNAFDVWAVRRLAICTDDRNLQSRRAIERLGATFEGVLRQHRRSTASGEPSTLRNTAVYSITTGEWPEIRNRLSERIG